MPLKVKHVEIEISKDSPFENCKLNRKQYADILTSILSTYEDGFVMAIDNPWGAGKTTFIKMWKQELINKGFKSIYFNAWENDFESNSLTALLAELKSIEGEKDSFKPLLKTGTILAKNLIPTLVKAVASKYLETKEFSDILEDSAKAGTEILEDEINKYSNKKKNIEEFKVELSKYVKNGDTSKPLIFFIDELDRCNPRYAVEVLEQVKHFFSVSGIIFILSIDKQQLGNSIRGYYGSDRINSNEYLRRFIDIEYSIPEPTTKDFCNYLFDYFDFDQFFSSNERNKIQVLREDKPIFLKFSSNLFVTKNLTLRQQEKLFSHARLVIQTFNSNHYVIPSVLIISLYLKYFEKENYLKIRNKEISNQRLNDLLETLIDPNEKGQYLYNFVYMMGQYLWMYNNYIGNYRGATLYKPNEEIRHEYILEIESHLNLEKNRDLLEIFKHLQSGIGFDLSIDYILNKIDLMENINK